MKTPTCPLPWYFACHAVIALIIAAVVWAVLGLVFGIPSALPAGLMAGMFFYVGREFTQWESGLPFDWKGLVAPVVVCLAVLAGYFWLV